uniref:Uncharacterized protein n=1 Tax=Candidatus Kentrum sp. TUN TaxID=2126343 RepID=A0A450ZUH6_9GAMM|nr:MAG: hypothetical protein BECKTUN1418E_GA0071001_10295 [Candidatus Kentron sp. TUN]VFK57454.1 MAG: hypothetical protein BECKTUN1418F_GA0071002_11165 [Candidatus Kentron sp. TUN]
MPIIALFIQSRQAVPIIALFIQSRQAVPIIALFIQSRQAVPIIALFIQSRQAVPIIGLFIPTRTSWNRNSSYQKKRRCHLDRRERSCALEIFTKAEDFSLRSK